MTTTELPAFEVGALVQARGREWVVLPQSEPPGFLVLRPLGGGDDEVAAVFPSLEQVSPATFEAPNPGDVGDRRQRRAAAHGPADRLPGQRRARSARWLGSRWSPAPTS